MQEQRIIINDSEDLINQFESLVKMDRPDIDKCREKFGNFLLDYGNYLKKIQPKRADEVLRKACYECFLKIKSSPYQKDLLTKGMLKLGKFYEKNNQKKKVKFINEFVI